MITNNIVTKFHEDPINIYREDITNLVNLGQFKGLNLCLVRFCWLSNLAKILCL